MKRIIALFAISLLAGLLSAFAQEKRPMTFEDVMALKIVADPQVSPDGLRVAYTVTTASVSESSTDSDVWLVATAGGDAVRLTTSKKNDSSPRWSPDGKRLAFLSAREEKPQIFLISPFGGEAERLTESKSGVQAFQWSPDGRRIAYVAQQEPTPEEEKRQKEKDDAIVVDKNFKFSRVWVIDLQTKKATELVKSDYVVSDPQWSPDGRQIAYTAVPTPKADDGSLSDIYILDVDSGKQRKLADNDGPDSSARWSPDGRRIAYLTRDMKGGLLGQLRLAVIASEGGAARLLSESFQYQPGSISWSPDGRFINFNSSVRTTSQMFSVPASGGEARQLSKIAGVLSAPTFSRDGSRVAFTKADLNTPADVYVSKSSDIAAVRLTNHNPEVSGLALGKGEVITWKSKDGMEIEGLLIYPVEYRPGKRYPTLTLVHGGPAGVWAQSFPGGWGNYGHVWAGKGWAVFYPNVRGSSGYGEKFLLSNVRDWGGGDFQDIQTGLDHLISKGISDPDKLAQSGWSYGGYMTAWTITQTTRFKSAMVGAGLTNMFSMYSTNDLQRTLEGYFGAEPWNDLEVYNRASAMIFIKRAKTPTLILHGAEDKRVPVGQAQELYMGLRKNNVPVELVFYPRQGHGLLEPKLQLDKMRREYAWHAKHVLGLETPAPPGK
ncbi:MAG TPA: S9 family peptidase [Blastocatellia bacterium]|nr:S9 family peptidase [Blastocatellia bacterium]